MSTVVKFQSQTTGRHLCIEKLGKNMKKLKQLKKIKNKQNKKHPRNRVKISPVFKLQGSLVYRDDLCMWKQVIVGNSVAYESFGLSGYFLVIKRTGIFAKRTRRLSKGAKWVVLNT